jgi:hypothetical protein
MKRRVVLGMFIAAAAYAQGHASGQPDIEGYWSNATITPFERPAALAGKEFLTEAKAAKLEQQARNPVAGPPREGDVGTELWVDRGTKVVKTRQTSLVVEPADRRVPPRAAAEAKRDYNRAHETDSYQYMSVWDRCITRSVPAGMFPSGHNNAYRIIQTPGSVVIVSEMIHDARVIPSDGSPHPPANVRFWNGDSRGHWEGKTLGGGHDELQRQRVDCDQRNPGKAAGDSAVGGAACGGALHTDRRRHAEL